MLFNNVPLRTGAADGGKELVSRHVKTHTGQGQDNGPQCSLEDRQLRAIAIFHSHTNTSSGFNGNDSSMKSHSEGILVFIR